MNKSERLHRSAFRTAGFTLAVATVVSLAGNVQHAMIVTSSVIPLWFALS